jgi:hypothetical protein
MDEHTRTVASRLLRDKTFIACSIIAALGIISLVLVIWYESHARAEHEKVQQQNTYEIRLWFCDQIEELKTAHRSTIKESLQEQRRFLKENPEGNGPLTRELIERGIARNERRLREFKPLPVSCKTFAVTGKLTHDGEG